jgi:hypothetical protein
MRRHEEITEKKVDEKLPQITEIGLSIKESSRMIEMP